MIKAKTKSKTRQPSFWDSLFIPLAKSKPKVGTEVLLLTSRGTVTRAITDPNWASGFRSYSCMEGAATDPVAWVPFSLRAEVSGEVSGDFLPVLEGLVEAFAEAAECFADLESGLFKASASGNLYRKKPHVQTKEDA